LEPARVAENLIQVLRRLYDWARRATQQGLARAIWDGMKAARRPADLPPTGQIRFGFA